MNLLTYVILLKYFIKAYILKNLLNHQVGYADNMSCVGTLIQQLRKK